MTNNLKKLALSYFNTECDKINLLYKLYKKENDLMDLKSNILQIVGYPDTVEVIEIGPLVLRVVPSGDVEVYTKDQYEKIEGFLND